MCDDQGRPVRLYLTAGLVSDFTGADVLLADLPAGTEEVIGDRRYDSNRVPAVTGRTKHHRLDSTEREPEIKAALQLASV